jgi:hypothetical protein
LPEPSADRLADELALILAPTVMEPLEPLAVVRLTELALRTSVVEILPLAFSESEPVADIAPAVRSPVLVVTLILEPLATTVPVTCPIFTFTAPLPPLRVKVVPDEIEPAPVMLIPAGVPSTVRLVPVLMEPPPENTTSITSL